jgi:hypothetical protein
MSRGLELFHIYAKTYVPNFYEDAVINMPTNIAFCGDTLCTNCPVANVKYGTTCNITQEEFQKLVVTHPEYMI